MAVDVSQQAYQAVYDVVQKILGGREEAAAYAEDPQGYLAAEGVADYDLSSVNMQQVVGQAASDMNAPTQPSQAAGGGGGGAGGASYPPPPAAAPPGQPPGEHLVQHINYVTNATYEGDDYITTQMFNQENYDYSTDIDNSSDVNLDGTFFGDVDIDTSSATATDGGVANTGNGDVVAATGDGAVAAGRDAEGVATGDGAVAAGRDIDGAVNTGEFTGAQAGGDVGTSVVGDGNTTLSDISDSNINFGGDQTTIQDSELSQSAVGGGNVQTSEINIDADDGSAVAFGAGSEASGSQDTIDAQHSNVQTGDGFQQADQSQETNVEVAVNESFNDQSVNDSFNPEVNDSFNDDSTNIDVALNTSDSEAPDPAREAAESGM